MSFTSSIADIAPLFSLRLAPGGVAIAILVVVAPITLCILALGYVAVQVCRTSEATEESVNRAWLVVKRATLILGGVAWLALTIVVSRAPAGPRPETVAAANLRTINTAQVTYRDSSGGVYGSIPDLISAGLLDERFQGPMFGYVYNVTTSDSAYTATAFPVSTKSGKYGFYSGVDGVVRYARQAAETCAPCFPRGMAGQPMP